MGEGVKSQKGDPRGPFLSREPILKAGRGCWKAARFASLWCFDPWGVSKVRPGGSSSPREPPSSS